MGVGYVAVASEIGRGRVGVTGAWRKWFAPMGMLGIGRRFASDGDATPAASGSGGTAVVVGGSG